MRTARRVQPDVAALGQQTGNRQAVILHKEDLAQKALIAAHAQHFLNQVYPRLVRRVGLAREDQAYGPFGIVQNARQPVRVGKEQGGPLVGREAPGKADEQGVRLEQVFHALALGPIELELLRKGRNARAQGVQKILFLGHAGRPVGVVRNLVHLVPDRGIRPGLEPVRPQILVEDLVHVHAHIGGRVHAVGHVVDGRFGQGQTFPELVPHMARNFAVQAAHAVGLGGKAQGQHGHFKGLAVAALHLAELGELLPGKAELGGDAAEIAAHEVQGKGLVARRHRRMRGEYGIGAHPHRGLRIAHAHDHAFLQAFDDHKG